jgi:DNA-directed RNA polymerase subunit RPC12/RpoP
MDEPAMEVFCKNCGKTFTAFLKEMADKNAEVTCPSCGKSGENCGPSAAMPPAAQN